MIVPLKLCTIYYPVLVIFFHIYSSSKFYVVKHLTWDKVAYSDTGVIITLQVTKTIQNFERLLRIPISDSSQRPEFCMKSGLEKMKLLLGYLSAEKDPVFNMYDNGKWVPMSKPRFGNFLRDHLEHLGLDSKLVTPLRFSLPSAG